MTMKTIFFRLEIVSMLKVSSNQGTQKDGELD